MFNRVTKHIHPYYDYATDAALANQAASVAVQAGGVIAQGKLNRKTREWNEKMLKQQREWALADWQMQNEYNDPSAQMARLKSAGLNPALVYGNGATTTADSVQRTSPESWNPKSPDMSGLAQSLFSGYDLQLKAAQIDNLKAQNTNILQDKLYKEAQTISTLSGAAKTDQDRLFAEQLFPGTIEGQKLLNMTTGQDLKQKSDLFAGSLEAQKLANRKMEVETSISLQANERAALSNAQSLSKGLEEILSLRQQRAKTLEEIDSIKQAREILKHDERIKALDAKMADQGMRPGDGWSQILAKEILQWLMEKRKSDSGPKGGYFSPQEYFKRFVNP